MKLAFQGINNHNAYDLDNDGMLDVVTTPHDVEVSSPTPEAGLWNLSLIGKSNGKHPEIARLEQIFKVEIVGVLSGWHENGRIKSLLECRNALGEYSELETDISEEARYSLPFLWDGPKPKQSAWNRWVGGEYPTEDWLENLFAHQEAKKIAARRSPVNAVVFPTGAGCRESELSPRLVDGSATPPITVDMPPANENTDGQVVDEIHCTICSRQLTNPTSRRLQIGPECRKRIGIKGIAFLRNDVVSDELKEASKLYQDVDFQKWIIRACLTLDAPLPTKVLNWLGNEWFGYRGSAILYYLDADGQLNRLDTFKRKLRHKVITKETAETELDSHAVRIASETRDDNGNGKRKLQMDKKLNTWFIEADGTKKAISCREICETFESKTNPRIVTRLRAGIDSGANISMVEID